MLKKHAKFFENILFIADLIVIVLAWLFSYYIRFYSGVMPVEKGIPSFQIYLYLIAPILFIWGFVFNAFELYRPKRLSSYIDEIFDIAKACSFSVLILVSLTFFFRQYDYSRLMFATFWAMTIVVMMVERIVFREVLRYLRRKGYNLRFAVIVGTGKTAEDIFKRIDIHPELGIKVVGFLSSNPGYLQDDKKGRIPVLGTYDNIKDVIKNNKIDQIIVALSTEEHHVTIDVLKRIDDEMVDIKVIPDLWEFMTLRGGIDELDGLPIITLQDTPLYGWNIVLKRATDIGLSIIAIIITAPVMILISVVNKRTSPGPILYKQERMGLDGKTFDMLKFRSMQVDAEAQSGAVWAKENDPRRTRLGTFLRKTSLDELPQFFNVLKGDMSIVGPRPERPVFIEEFRKNIPGYMLRHKMKAGITGWAQVNGWRGNTSLEKRIECDLYYIENWSLWLDIKIMWLTVWKGLLNKNAY
ncbi:MAG: undecaprenyl-phosphate glucose phosphotransferase [Deltaproteobacteria bacterium]|nr:undecaprenyl-phosphate glucose phosphotransferase [Deltaproteobacteria bacterium]